MLTEAVRNTPGPDHGPKRLAEAKKTVAEAASVAD